MNKFILSGSVVAMVVLASLGETEDAWYGKQEAACMEKGGLCILYTECSQPIIYEEELCPLQAAKGFQCCFGLPEFEQRCSVRGGHCMKKGSCSPDLVYRDASNCEDDEDCCVLI